MENEYQHMPYDKHPVSSGYNTRRSAHLHDACEYATGVVTRSRKEKQDYMMDDYPTYSDGYTDHVGHHVPIEEEPQFEVKTKTRKRQNTSSGMEKRTANKICRVCGDKAFSYNFNVITCESCKAFFRRNANKEKEIRCPFNENCEINVVSRRFCQKCRLAKCFQVGMKKEWIMSEEARAEKKARVEENREKRFLDSMREGEEDDKDDNDLDYSNDSNNMMSGEYPSDGMNEMSSYYNSSGFDTINSTTTTTTNLTPFCAAPHMVDIVTAPSYTNNPMQTPVSAPVSMIEGPSSSNLEFDPPSISAGGFIPPKMSNEQQSSYSVVVDSQMPSIASSDAVAAVHAAINHRQTQLAAAVVAQQVVAQITGAPPPPPTTQPAALSTVPPIFPNQNLPTTVQSSVPVNIDEPKSPHTIVINSINASADSEMVTVPKEVLMKLIQSTTLRTMNCTCTCTCGRYPPGTIIVDEVTRDLLSNNPNNENGNTEPSKDTEKLDTTEDYERNGLLPSSVEWLNSSNPPVNPAALPEEAAPPGRRDSIFNIPSDLEMANPPPFETEEQGKLEEITLLANEWISCGLDVQSMQEILSAENLVRLVQSFKLLSAIHGFSANDQIALISKGVYSYCIVKYLQYQEGIALDGLPEQLVDLLQSFKFQEEVIDIFRKQPGFFNTLAVMLIFDVNSGVVWRDGINQQRLVYEKILQRLMLPLLDGNADFTTLAENVFPKIHEAGNALGAVFNFDADFIAGRWLTSNNYQEPC